MRLGILNETTADTAIALALMAGRRLVEGVDLARSSEWLGWRPEQLCGLDLHGGNVAIIGMGGIGRAIARRCLAFDCTVRYSTVTSVVPGPWHRRSIDDLLPWADFLFLAVPLTEHTYHLIGSSELRRMSSNAVLVNIARGRVVDTDALVNALSRGAIRAAGLDVTDPEPLPFGHPLQELGNCVLLPHLGSASERTRTKMAQLAVANVEAVFTGRPLLADALTART